ncbi:Hypothetical protein, putative [Bodo saltans]|uniref:ATP pyrophosphate-lyase n=1 Tax=Bodo saltans TaxID=75058 RepID=A0A0S4IWW7_BODSA|nr:Hypothetical protein, putative [Bodo saltans]|eukprot:CUG33746.1 Hypothetical protein, putative [Bodo saltans]
MSLGATSHHGKEQAAVDGPGIRFGVATGKALCGNLGTDKIKRFCTLGPVLNHAQVLVDMCRVYGVTNLARRAALKGMGFEYVCDNVTIGVLPSDSNPAIVPVDASAVAYLVGSIRERKSSKMDEWMYELQEGEAAKSMSTGDLRTDTISTMSYALEKLFEGDCQKALVVIDAVQVFDDSLSARVQHVKKLATLRSGGGVYPHVGIGLLVC